VAAHSFSTSAFVGRAPLGRGWDGRFGLRRFRAKPRTKSSLSLTARPLVPCHPPSASVLSFSPSRLFSSAGAQVKNENKPATAEKEKTMKSEEIKNKTNEAVSYLVAALESGQNDVLTQYLNAMARFHNYSFGNIMLIARQRAGT
jgi:hypothetical protein